ncbi:hypothetical protein XELAEV_18000251mg [Xenopus laevis]|uniref:Uncharacterized protein n=1 Tax=Xenopus laevis TaxID=8355 RepID=A0A974GZ40_XENLA|nr:hypothetical protein XELAEV_18000251mg [Xenopus laevis]
MGTKQTKVCQASAGDSPQQAPGSRKGTPARERGDFWPSFSLRCSEKVGKSGAASLPPYHRRVRMIQDMMALVRQGKQEEAMEVLRHLRQMEDGEEELYVGLLILKGVSQMMGK